MSIRIYEKYLVVIALLGQLLSYIQGYTIFMHQSAQDVSFVAFLLNTFAVISWAIYGVLLKNKPLLITNIFGTIGCFIVLLGIIMYG